MKLQNIRHNLGTAMWSLRQSVSGIFMKPSFIIIGAQKSGTGSLYTYLSKHPDIVQPFNKEIHYFDNGVDPSEDNYSKGKSWYRARFPCRLLYLNKLTFEASPAYLFHPEVPERI